MSKNLRREQKQIERDEKFRESLKNGKAVRVVYENRKKKTAQPNRKCEQETVEEELEKRQDKVERATIVYRNMLPGLLVKLARIKDPRNPRKVKHKMAVLMIYGILMFVFQIGSRREANKCLSKPILWNNLQGMFPEFESMPHADTLARLLEKIEAEQIQECYVELLRDLIRKKKFKNHLINKRYLIAVDGSQKFFREYQWAPEALKRHVGGEAHIPQFYVYTLESVLILDNGMVLPVLTEVLENLDWKEGETKQDCERRAFRRLAPKLVKLFGRGKVTLVADGLYACGPLIQICRDYRWDYMIVFKQDAIPELWKEATGLMRLEDKNRLRVMWGDRQQDYCWANDIPYEYGTNARQTVIVHVVLCNESWTEYNPRSSKEKEELSTQYIWISSRPITQRNVFFRCTKMARYRWKIENNFLIEKHEGYYYEHVYSYTWCAMKAFHYLMKIGHFLNVMAVHSEILANDVQEKGIRGFISDLYLSLAGAVLDKQRICNAKPCKVWKLKSA